MLNRQPAQAALVAAIAVWSQATLFTQLLFREHDDNRLTSWRWVFGANDIPWLVPAHLAALLLAVALSRGAWPWRRPRTLLFLGAWAAALPLWGEPEVIVDAARYFAQAKHLELYGLDYFCREWGGEIAAWTDLPLLPLVYGLIFRLAGESRSYIQALTTLLFAASVLLTYGIGRSLWSERVGFWAGALLLAMPYLLVQVPLLLVDVAAMALLCAALWATLRALERGGAGWLILAALAVALAAAAKYSNWLWLSVLAVAIGVRWREASATVPRRAGWLIAGALLLLSIAGWPLRELVVSQLALLFDWQWTALGRWRESMVSTFLFQIHPFVSLAALLSLAIAWRSRDARYLIVAWLPALGLAMGVARSRYLLPLLPMLALMAAYGLAKISADAVRRTLGLYLVFSALLIAVFGYRPFLLQDSAANLQRAGAYLDTLDAAAVEVVTLPQLGAPINPALSVALLDYYTSKRLIYRPQPIPPPPGAEASPLRFSWLQKTPDYYAGSGQSPAALVVVAGDEAQYSGGEPRPIGEAYGLAREFVVSTRVFGYQTMVRVYKKTQD